ncbi:MAG: hypothetical protein Q9183_003619 [Haloplaca sp. 2 TL-2023]
MKAVLQRVASASVSVDTQLVSSIGKGVLVFAAVAPDDTPKEIESMASKVLKMKMWPDEWGTTWKRSVQDIKGEVLCVSQFTLLASTKKGSKPDFHGAAGGTQAREMYDQFVTKVEELYEKDKVKNGVFAAMMQVNIQNDGPVTLEIQTNPATEEQGAKAEAKAEKTKRWGEKEEKEEREDTKSKFELPAELLE